MGSNNRAQSHKASSLHLLQPIRKWVWDWDPYESIRFIVNSKIWQNVMHCCIENGEMHALWDTFCPICNPTMLQICDILLQFAINFGLTQKHIDLQPCRGSKSSRYLLYRVISWKHLSHALIVYSHHPSAVTTEWNRLLTKLGSTGSCLNLVFPLLPTQIHTPSIHLYSPAFSGSFVRQRLCLPICHTKTLPWMISCCCLISLTLIPFVSSGSIPYMSKRINHATED